MSVIFSKSCEYAIQAILFLAKSSNGKPILMRDISQTLNVPHPYPSKIFQTLTHHGILLSHKGPSGGFALAHPATAIALIDVVREVDGDAFLNQCILGFASCSDRNPCPAHSSWMIAKSLLLNLLQQKTVEELSRELSSKLESGHKLSA